jgi:TRAP-type uncharacterized transport system fused permease subunit
MGSGVPTTPTYIILASIAAPALAQLGVPLLATHFFVFYYGVLADVTPPVALAAYAAAGIARSEPMRTGMTAFRLSMGKALVPFMFVYTPSLLFVDFTWGQFVASLVGCLVAILGLGAAYTGYAGARDRPAGVRGAEPAVAVADLRPRWRDRGGGTAGAADPGVALCAAAATACGR